MNNDATYELWDMHSCNAVAEFATEADALAAIRVAIAQHSRSYIEMLFLGRADTDGNSTPVAQGQVLAERALCDVQPDVFDANLAKLRACLR